MGRYPPAHIILYEDGSYPNLGAATPAGALETYSVDTLVALFPGIDLQLYTTSGGTQWHDWNGDGVLQTGNNGRYELQGYECLVFWLGGIPSIDAATGAIGGQGFCTDKTRPALATPGRTRIGPFFEFRSDRLNTAVNPSGRPNNRFALYRDVWNDPYLYFASRYATDNSYPCPLFASPRDLNDCYTLVPNFVPYYKSSRAVGNTTFFTFHRADKFQIISAGRDQQIGSGRQYNPEDPETSLTNRFDRDNMTNFHTGLLAPR
jgi:hypothetical protein